MSNIEALVYELFEPRKLYLKKELIDPGSLLPNELIAKTCYTALSPGTELGAYCGMEPLRTDIPAYPRVVGYCNIAQVIYKGGDVTKLDIGDYFLNFQSHRSHFKYSENDFFIKLSGATIKNQCAAYLFHLGYHSLLTGRMQQGHNVGIIGLGTLGYATSVMSKIAGAATFVLSNQPSHKALLESKQIILLPKDISSVDTIYKRTHQIGIDVVINTSNTWDDWALALHCVNKGGTIVNLGFPGRDQPLPKFNPLDPRFLYMKNVTIKYLTALNRSGFTPHEQRFNMERNLLYILDLMENNVIDAGEVISVEIPYIDLEKQYLLYELKKENLFSTLLNWQ